jgi:hypothetical protein
VGPASGCGRAVRLLGLHGRPRLRSARRAPVSGNFAALAAQLRDKKLLGCHVFFSLSSLLDLPKDGHGNRARHHRRIGVGAAGNRARPGTCRGLSAWRLPTHRAEHLQDERGAEAPGAVDEKSDHETRQHRRQHRLSLNRRYHEEGNKRERHGADKRPASPIGRADQMRKKQGQRQAPNSAPERLGQHRRYPEGRSTLASRRRWIRSAGLTSSPRMPAFKLSTRFKSFPSPIRKRCWQFTLTALS